VDGAFVHAEGEFATGQALELAKALFYFVSEIDQAVGVVPEQGSGVGQADGTGSADEQRLAEAVFQFANREADGGLGSVKTLCGAGEAALLGNHQKHLEFAEIHGLLPLRGV
jgi:hypothetical protein